MSPYITKPSIDFISNIEDAIIEFGVIACPNPSCNKKLISKKKIDVNNNAFLEYACQNPKCNYHQKRKIPIPLEKISVTGKSNLQLKNISYSKILYASLFVLLCISAYTSFHLYNVNQFIENEVSDELDNNHFQKESNSDLKINEKSNHRAQTITLNKTVEKRNNNFSEFVNQTKVWVSSGNFKQAKINFKRLLEDQDYRDELLNPKNKNLRYELLELIGDSYDKSKPQLSYEFLKDRISFEIFEKFISTFDSERKIASVYLGKAYLNLPNILEEEIGGDERKKMQLIALNYYLNAAKQDRLGKYHKSSIKEVNEICKTYRLYSYSSKKPKKYISTEKIILQKKNDVIQHRINFVEQIIKNIL